VKRTAEDRPLRDAESNREPVEALLALATRLARAERAFLARSGGEGGDGGDVPRIDAFAGSRPDGQRLPSRTALARALAAPGPVLWLDAAGEPDLDSASVRALELRSVLAAPLDVDRGRAALVLDTRHGTGLSAAELWTVLEPLTALLSLLLRAGPRRPAAAGAPAPPAAYRGFDGAWVARVAATDLPVLIRGESGAGKESVARDLHRLSRRHAGPYVAVNCAALAESLLEAELFGAVRGAYTGAERDRPGLLRRAAGGTLFLDEVGDMPGPMQAKLLRALEQGRVRPVGGAEEVPVDVRIVAATHHDLAGRVGRGLFRHDLYYRLAVLRIDVPPLRDRLADLPALVADLAPRLLAETASRQLRLSAAAWSWLRAQSWPGNVRELHAVLARALLRSGGRREIHVDDLEPLDAPGTGSHTASLEAQMIAQALDSSAGRFTEAARRIGWTRQKLHRRARALGLDARQRGSTSSHSSTFQ